MRTGEAPGQVRGGFLVGGAVVFTDRVGRVGVFTDRVGVFTDRVGRVGVFAGRVGDRIRARTAWPAHCVDSHIRMLVLRRSPAGVVKRAGRICAVYSSSPSQFVYGFFNGCILTNLAPLQVLQVQKKKKTKAMEAPILQDYLLDRKRSIPLNVYMGLEGGPLVKDAPPGQDEGYHPRHLHLRAQRAMFLSIRLVLSVIRIGHCPRNLSVKSIVLTRPDFSPRFLQNVDFVHSPDNSTCDAAMSALAGIFERIMRDHLPEEESVPDEVHNLLYLMRQPDSFKLTEAIQLHTCLVPLENRGHLFLKEYQYTIDILRKIEPLHFRYVMTQMVIPRHWKIRTESNPYVQAVVERGDYDSLKSYAQLKPLELQRNAPCHSLQDAADKRAPHGLGFKPVHMNHALYIMSEHLLASLQLALHRVGHLGCLRTSFLFPWN